VNERVDGRSGKESQGVFGWRCGVMTHRMGHLTLYRHEPTWDRWEVRSLDSVYRMGRQRVATPECKLALIPRGGLLTSRRRRTRAFEGWRPSERSLPVQSLC